MSMMQLAHAAVSEWTPQSYYWQHIQESQSGLTTWLKIERDDTEEEEWEERDQYDAIKTCFQDSVTEDMAREFEQSAPGGSSKMTSSSTSTPTVVRMLNTTVSNDNHRHGDAPFLVEIASALTPHQAKAIRSLAACMREHVPNAYERRGFHEGGNDVTFLNTVLQIFLPSVAATVQAMAEMSFSHVVNNGTDPDFYYPPPGNLGLRTTEHLSYFDFKHLGEHDDGGSVYTVLFSLSDPQDYEGGEYYVLENGNRHTIKPEQYSAIVFLSKMRHGVTDIQSGHREMFTNELWIHADPPWQYPRPYHGVMMLYMERCNQGGLHPQYCAWPSEEEVEAWLEASGLQEMDDGYLRPIVQNHPSDDEEEEGYFDDENDDDDDDDDDEL